MGYNANIISAEQKRYKLTNADMAKILKCSRPTYEKRKRLGKFTLEDITIMCTLFNKDYNELFNQGEVKINDRFTTPA